jgi:hypothetical protein
VGQGPERRIARRPPPSTKDAPERQGGKIWHRGLRPRGSPNQRAFAVLLPWLRSRPISVVSAILLFAFNGPFSSLNIGGLIQRLYWLVFTVWLIFEAQQLLPNRVLSMAP